MWEETRFSIICGNLLNAMLTLPPIAALTGAMIQNATIQSYCTRTLQSGQTTNTHGHTYVQRRRTSFVPNLCCIGGKARRVHRAWDTPVIPRKSEIWRGSKPNPPSSGVVNQNNGKTDQYVSSCRGGKKTMFEIANQLYLQKPSSSYDYRYREPLPHRETS